MVLSRNERMNENGQKKSQQLDNPSADGVGFYVYCIAQRSPAEELASGSTPIAIEDGAGLELISGDKLAAVVSRVPLSEYDESSLAENLKDATWTAVRAMRHEQVVEFFAKRTSVVPLRFGTIYLDRSNVERMLCEKESQLGRIIDRLKDSEEWGVNVYYERSVLFENIVNVSPRLREMSDAAKKAAPGQSYLMQKKIEALRTDEAKLEIKRIVDDIESNLRPESDDAERLRILKVETTEHGELKAKFAFLIQRSRFDAFRRVAEDIAFKYESAGVRIELTGPWPAYNFAGEATD